jgi:hypothetical protein
VFKQSKSKVLRLYLLIRDRLRYQRIGLCQAQETGRGMHAGWHHRRGRLREVGASTFIATAHIESIRHSHNIEQTCHYSLLAVPYAQSARLAYTFLVRDYLKLRILRLLEQSRAHDKRRAQPDIDTTTPLHPHLTSTFVPVAQLHLSQWQGQTSPNSWS